MKIGFPALLFVVFLILKLTHVINWSWLWITAPLWLTIPLAVIIVIAMAITAKIKFK